MGNNILILHEFSEKAKIAETILEEWQKYNLIKPIGFTEDKTPLYSEESLDKVIQIKKFQEMGYELEEIQKIFKKVGRPKSVSTGMERSGKNQFLTIGNLAEHVGVSTRTIKHWEESLRLLSRISWPSKGFKSVLKSWSRHEIEYNAAGNSVSLW